MTAPEGRGGRASRALAALGVGAGGAFFVCCVLPIVVAAVAGAAVAAPLAKFDNPLLLGVGSVGTAVLAWLFMSRRAPKPSEAKVGSEAADQ